MAIYSWSILANGQTVSTFDPDADTLFFDDILIAAASVNVDGQTDIIPFTTIFLYGGKTVIINMNPLSATSANVTFANGSRFLVGDNTTGAVNDDDANTLIGTNGHDQIIGLGGSDSLSGGDGNDLFTMYAGESGLWGGDTISGGNGTDTLMFPDPTNGIVVNLGSGTGSGGDGSPGSSLTLNGIEDVVGTPFDDAINGSDGANKLQGRAGNDVLDGGLGADTADYSDAVSGVAAHLWLSLASNDGHGGSDTLISIENLSGSAFNDTLAGDDNGNLFKGGAGIDAMYGGGGIDTVDYSDATGGVFAELWGRFASSDGQGSIDYLVDIENVTGSAFSDTFGGDNNNNIFKGGAGNDALFGGGGIDTADYSGATGGVFVELWKFFASNDGQGGSDVLVDIENVTGSGFNDIFGGDNNNNVFKSGAGIDALFGGGGIDTADYSGATSGVFAELWKFFASNDGQGGTDVLVDIENVTGSAFNDTFGGDNNNNVFKGGAGVDALFGGGGIDTADYSGATSGVFVELWKFFASNDGQGGSDVLVDIENVTGSAFADTFAGDHNDNVFKSGAGVDALFGGGGIDTADYSGATSGVFVELWKFFASNDGQGGSDVLVDIENVTGSAFNDTVAGDDNNNAFKGGAGNDALYGGGGVDTADYSGAISAVVVQLYKSVNVVVDGQGGADILVDIENITGSAFGDLLEGDTNANRLEGAGGNDDLWGLGGADSFVYGGGSGEDWIFTFDKAQGNKILLQSNLNGSGITTPEQALAHVSDVSSETCMVDLGGGNSVTLVGVTAATLAASDFLIF